MDELKKDYMHVLSYLVVRYMIDFDFFKVGLPFLSLITVLEYYNMYVYISIMYHCIIITKIHFLLYK